MWTSENTYHTYLYILQSTNGQKPSQEVWGDLVGGVRTPCTLPLDPPSIVHTSLQYSVVELFYLMDSLRQALR